MKKRYGKVMAFIAVITMTCILNAETEVYASGWQKDDTGWWYATDETNTSRYKNCWQWIDGDKDGLAQCYRFDSNGYIYMNTITPDYCYVDESGAWTVHDVVQNKSADQIKSPDLKESTRFTGGLYSLAPDPEKVAKIEEMERQKNYQCPYDQKYWYVRLDLDYDSYDMAEPHILEERQALEGYLKSLSHDDAMSYLAVHTNYKQWKMYTEQDVRNEKLISQGYEVNILSEEQIEEVKEAEQDFLDNYINDDMSDFEKEMEIVRYLCENVDYDYDSYELLKEGNANEEAYISGTGYGALVNGLAVCDGYANAFYRLCDVCGIEANIINGTVDTGGKHQWNMVKLEDGWYWVDVTWADTSARNGVNTVNINATTPKFERHNAQKVVTGKNIKKATGKKYGQTMVNEYLGK